nr:tRNA-specific 2-thiouridylase MnmA [Chlamydiota bacterium]
MKTVAVGMSGGVDSSVAALLLKEAGYKVIGLFMKNWEEKDDRGICTSATDFDDANRVAEKLQIPLIPLNFSEEYWERVFKEFLAKLAEGLTPNPDVLCNREIKFDCLLEKAHALGADFLATGHYCQTENGQLLKGADPLKDQSYFLHLIEGKLLREVLFPIGHLPKAEVRALAKKSGLPTHAKKDSTGICFIGKRDFKSFISDYIPYHKGQFEDTQGKVIGEHAGCAFYTIGQRKGLGIGGPGEAWFVVGKDIKRNVVIIEQGTDHP